jgi:hypothetical protein
MFTLIIKAKSSVKWQNDREFDLMLLYAPRIEDVRREELSLHALFFVTENLPSPASLPRT